MDQIHFFGNWSYQFDARDFRKCSLNWSQLKLSSTESSIKTTTQSKTLLLLILHLGYAAHERVVAVANQANHANEQFHGVSS